MACHDVCSCAGHGWPASGPTPATHGWHGRVTCDKLIVDVVNVNIEWRTVCQGGGFHFTWHMQGTCRTDACLAQSPLVELSSLKLSSSDPLSSDDADCASASNCGGGAAG